MSTSLLQRCSRAVLLRPATFVQPTRTRDFSSSVAVTKETKVEPGKKVAPHDGVPFAAPPRDEMKGELGQVFLPDMASIEYVAPAPIQIPGEPDNYSLLSTDSSLDSFPHSRDRTMMPKVFTVTAKETHLGGGPESAGGREDPVV